MNNRRRWMILGVVAGLTAAVWVASFGTGVSAHEGHKRKNAPASAKKLKNPLTATDENMAAGGRLFMQNCASCHGEDGKSQTDIAKTMKVKPTDLTGKAMQGITDGEIHAQNPPGVLTMKRLKAVIKYRFEETERGGRVRIATGDAKALAAIHEFLRFQISDHQTGDSTEVEKTP